MEPNPGSSSTSARSADARPAAWQKLPALSGVAFAVLLIFAWFLSGGNTPDYIAADGEWTDWAGDNRSRSGIGGLLILLGGIAFLHFAGTIRRVIKSAETSVRGSGSLADLAFGGALVGIVGIGIALLMVAGATSEGSDVDPVVSRAVMTSAVGPYLVAAMGFAGLLGAAGVSTLRSGTFARWTGVVALIGAAAFLVTFLTLVDGTGHDSVFGYGFLPGIAALVIWSIATSLAEYRAVATAARQPAARDGEA